MNTKGSRSITILLSGLLFYACESRKVDFSTEIKPILNKSCISCHGGVKKQGGFSLLFEEDAFAQLSSGEFGIVPGDPSSSEMIRRLTVDDPEERMPYHEDPLPEEEIKLLEEWVRQGAEWGEHWAYQPVEAPKVPDVAPLESNIDRFILEKLTTIGLTHSPEADPRILARRVGLDLIGFPAPAQISAPFLSNPTEKTYAIMVDSLLASPHFGEKWATMWLDLARYADSKGYVQDFNRDIWHFRDWVIKALNQDMPYDEFITKQLAGDLLSPFDEDNLIATAFHRNTMTNDEGGTDNEEFRTVAVLDRVNTTWEALMGTTFACIQCHSHPYDPFLHEEYYEFLAFFNNTRDLDTHYDYPLYRHFDENQKKQLNSLIEWADQKGTETQKKELEMFLKTFAPARYGIETDQLVNAAHSNSWWLSLRNNSSVRLQDVDLTKRGQLIMKMETYRAGGTLKVVADSLNGPLIGQYRFKENDVDRSWRFNPIDLSPSQGTHDIFLTYHHPDQSNPNSTHLKFDWMHFNAELPGKGQKEYEKIEKAFWDLLEKEVPTTPVLVENPDYLSRTTYVFERGNRLSLGAQVFPDVPASLNPFPDEAPRDRLGLSKWISDKQNPLTSRTITNRIWEQLFGYGIVETLEDLGTQGADPTHKELLDFISWQLMHAYDWSLKALIREIVVSKTYKQSSILTEELQKKDPDNLYLARMNRVRLSAEQIRDQALFVSGAFNPEMYGPPVTPHQAGIEWNNPYQDTGADNQYRRAIYTYWKRTNPYPSMMTFDGVSREVCSSRRIRTNTPLQALVTLNDSVYFDLSRKLMDQVWDDDSDVKSTISEAYQVATGMPPTKDRVDALNDLYLTSKEVYEKHPEKASMATAGLKPSEPVSFASLCIVGNAIINLDEMITKN